MTTWDLECQGCGATFSARSPRAKWHSPGCKKAAQRKAAGSVVDAAGDGAEQKPSAESVYGRDVLDAVRRDLIKADRLETVDGRVALYLARKSIDPDAKNPAALFTQMRQALATALAGTESAKPAAPSAEPENEVEKARHKRERKARQAQSR